MSRPERESSRPLTSTPRLPGEARLEQLENGLAVCLLRNPQAPIVTCALWYRAGTRDEGAAEGGVAHFLEHMMFKGSRAYGPGEIDRRTQALGGSNNAFTSHDATAYYFNFARNRWTEALAIEADRMSGLTLDPGEVARERQVILEEITMYEDEPWDALELEVQRTLFGEHPYGRPVLGTKQSLRDCDSEVLAAFHSHFYTPDNAVLVVAGDLPESSLDEVSRTLGAVPRSARPRPPVPPASASAGWQRVERRAGEVPRLLVTLPAPPASHEDHAALRMLVTLLATGRASRLQERLVDEEHLCLWISGSLNESPVSGQMSFALELVPGVEPRRVEEELLAQLEALASEPPDDEELARARQVLKADWVFGHERVHQQALAARFALTHFDLDHPYRSLRRALELGPGELARVASDYLRPHRGGVIGWSLPRRRPV